jgi:glutaminyl-peptide cyclotransferase
LRFKKTRGVSAGQKAAASCQSRRERSLRLAGRFRSPARTAHYFSLLLATVFLFACSDNTASSNSAVGSATPTATIDNKQKTTAFDGERAFNHVKAQVAFGPRPAGSAALEKTRDYLLRELKSYGLTTTVDEFTARTPQGKVKFKNLIAELPGATSDLILIASHYDTKPFKEFAFVGANDGGSSTGALLEIARVMAAEHGAGKQPRRFTYQFIFFDGEEAFCREWSDCLNGKDNTYGSRHLVERMQKEKQLNRVKTLILLDMVGDKDLTIPREETSSAWLVQTIWSTAQELGYAKQFPERSFAIGDDDHMPFLRAGVSAVDIIDFEYGTEPEDNSYWHTSADTLNKISPQSLKIVGDVVLLSLPRIETQIK